MEKEKKNPIKEWWHNITHTRSNYKKVKSSPYASLVFALKVRKMILIPLILFLVWKGYDIISNYHATGFMNVVGKAIMFAVFAYLIYRIWKTIPAAKKQIEYYKKYPHVINYCPTNVKEDVDDILNKIKENQNQLNLKEAEKNVQKNDKGRREKEKNSNATKSTRRD